MTSGDHLVASLRRAAHDLAATRSIHDLHQTLTQIVHSAVDTVPHVDAGGIVLSEDGVVTSRNPSDPTVTELDGLQSRLHEGPSITAIEDPPPDGVVVAHDLAHDLAADNAPRWPRFAPEAVRAGYRSMLSTHLAVEGGRRAALNLYSREANVFDADTRRVAGLFGVQAATLLAGSEQVEHLQHAVERRELIGQAKGILMERFTVDDDGASAMLVQASQDTDMTIADVARWLRGEARHRYAEHVALPGDDLPETGHQRAQQDAERAPWGDGAGPHPP